MYLCSWLNSTMWKLKSNNKVRKNVQKVMKMACNIKRKVFCTRFQYNYHPKWGQFIPKQRVNADQCPFMFALDIKRTYDHYETGKWLEHNTWISTPGEGLTIRQCSLQISVTPDWQQSRLALVFPGNVLKLRKY